MNIPCLAVLAVVAIATVSAVECSQDQLAAYSEVDQAPFEKACPSLFLEGDGAVDPSRLETFTTASLKALEPCKETACLSQQKTFRDATPDCEVRGFNLKSFATVTIKLCEAFNAGAVSVEAAKSMFQDSSKSINDAFGSLVGDEGSEEDGSAAAGDKNVAEDKPADTTGKDTPAATTKPGAVPTPAPTTAKSDASSMGMVTGAAVSAIAMSLVF